MPLLNYSTSVPMRRTVEEIQGLLARKGASRISLDYTAGKISGVSFELKTPRGTREFVLPARVEAVRKVLWEQYRNGEGPTRGQTTPEHAERVAWRIVLEWLKVQMALVESAQAEFAEIMLPYMIVAEDEQGRPLSLYAQFRADRALPSGDTRAAK